MRIVIVGPGALGCLFGAQLARAGNDVSILARRPEHAAALNANGITVAHAGEHWSASPRVSASASELGPADLAILLVKSMDTASAARAAAEVIHADGCALTLQNGIGNAELLAEAVGPGRALAGITSQGATVLDIGSVRHAGFGPTAFAEFEGGPSARSERIAALLTEASIPASAHADWRPLVWAKLIANAAINPLGAILRRANGTLIDEPNSLRVFEQLAAEAGAVAAAAGVHLPFADPVEHAKVVAEATRANMCSMLQDVSNGRRTEIDAINGAIARIGAELGVPTPNNQLLADIIRSMEPRETAG
jgi:2-dehydropantoate 2-reductase